MTRLLLATGLAVLVYATAALSLSRVWIGFQGERQWTEREEDRAIVFIVGASGVLAFLAFLLAV